MRRDGRPEVMVTDNPRSYGAALKEIDATERNDAGGWRNNRAENSHLPFRRRERAMLRFRQMGAFKNSRLSTYPSRTTSTKNAAHPAERPSRSSAPSLSPSGGRFVPGKIVLTAASGDEFELVCQHRPRPPVSVRGFVLSLVSPATPGAWTLLPSRESTAMNRAIVLSLYRFQACIISFG